MIIWTLVQEFNWKDFQLQTKDNLGSNKGFRIEENLNSTRDLNSKEGLNIFKERKRIKEGFEILLEIKNWLGSEMKFELTDFIEIKGYLNS
jgi:hypothetical protein